VIRVEAGQAHLNPKSHKRLRRPSMRKGEEYTLEDLDRDVLEALNAQPGENKGPATRPNVLEKLKSASELNRIKDERI
jgi:hypothetical protein